MSSITVSEDELVQVLCWVRNLRKWAVRTQIDPWAIRQGLVMALEMDTAAALKRGIKPEDLQNFDQVVRQDIKAWIKEQI